MKILIFGFSSGCSACNALHKRLEPFLAENESAREHIKFVDCEEHPEAVEYYQVQHAPTILCVDKCGHRIMEITKEGYKPTYDYENDFLRQIRHEPDYDGNCGDEIAFDLNSL